MNDPVDWSKVSAEVLGEYTTRAISDLEKCGENITTELIRNRRDRMYRNDIQIASIVNGMNIGDKNRGRR